MSTAMAPGPKLSRKERGALQELIWRRIVFDPVGGKPEGGEALEAWTLLGKVRGTLNFLAATRTLNEHAGEGEEAIQPFPVCAACAKDRVANEDVVVLGEPPRQLAVCRAHGRRHKPYFRALTEQWHPAEILNAEKSRQILGSWWAVGVHLWLALVRPGSLVAFQSDSQSKANELLERGALMYRTLPLELQRFGPLSESVKAAARKIEDEMTFRHVGADGRVALSRVKAIPCGPNQVRMYTFTACFMDECQHWESDGDFEDSYAAALATVKGGGKLTTISSVGHPDRYHHRLCAGLVA